MSRIADATERTSLGEDQSVRRPNDDFVEPTGRFESEWGHRAADAAADPATLPLRALNSAAKPLQAYVAGLVQQVFFSPASPQTAVRSLMFAAVDVPGSSALFCAAAAELLVSRTVARVCVVDANLGAASLHNVYAQPNDNGLLQALTAGKTIQNYARRVAQGHESSLWLLPAGAAGDDGNRVLEAQPDAVWVRDLIDAFDYVLIDAPAIAPEGIASRIMGAEVGGVVLVVEANQTRRRVARAAADQLRGSGARVVGTVLNNRTFPVPEMIYRRL